MEEVDEKAIKWANRVLKDPDFYGPTATHLARALISSSERVKELEEALETFRGLVSEGSMPRYMVTPGAVLNAVIEEVVDPALRLWPPPTARLQTCWRRCARRAVNSTAVPSN